MITTWVLSYQSCKNCLCSVEFIKIQIILPRNVNIHIQNNGVCGNIKHLKFVDIKMYKILKENKFYTAFFNSKSNWKQSDRWKICFLKALSIGPAITFIYAFCHKVIIGFVVEEFFS